MFWKREAAPLGLIGGGFLLIYYLPIEPLTAILPGPVLEAVALARWYAREHVLLCLVPAFFIAGAIGVFLSQDAVLKYLGARANKVLSYAVASISGTVLAVCSCTVLPLFAGIYQRGAGLGPATAFLYSGPAINVLAIILTARILGLELGVARAAGAVGFSVVIGLLMHLLFRREEAARTKAQSLLPEPEAARPLWQSALFLGAMVAILVFANWGAPAAATGWWHAIYSAKWYLTGAAALLLAGTLIAWFGAGRIGRAAAPAREDGELNEWLEATWGFTKQILPLLLLGVLAAGFLLGRPGREGIIPSAWITTAVGGNSLAANLFASVAGALMYFATLTEVPIVQGLMGGGMGKGPALALLLAGPALSLPSMLVIRSIMGTRKMLAFVGLVVGMATLTGVLYGSL